VLDRPPPRIVGVTTTDIAEEIELQWDVKQGVTQVRGASAAGLATSETFHREPLTEVSRSAPGSSGDSFEDALSKVRLPPKLTGCRSDRQPVLPGSGTGFVQGVGQAGGQTACRSPLGGVDERKAIRAELREVFVRRKV
jgi:hypothetical protein